MKLHILTGFLGSGKTTAIRQAATSLLNEKIAVSVITNDQGSRLVDGNFFESLGIPGAQVAGGCFCCNYNELDRNIQLLANIQHAAVIFAEAVGSCTDIIATVLKPLQQFHPDIDVTVSTFTDIRLLKMMLAGSHGFDESVAYIYHKQLEEAEIIVINKTDLESNETIRSVSEQISGRYKGKLLLFQNSLDKKDIQNWLTLLDNYKRDTLPSSLIVDYDVYAAGEAMMAWYDQQLEIFTETGDALRVTQDLINAVYSNIERLEVPIGHIKFLIDDSIKISFTAAGEKPVQLQLNPAFKSTLLINIRVQVSPEIVQKLVDDLLIQFEEQCKIVAMKADAFRPGYPTPVHRM